MTLLYSPYRLGSLELPNRVVMAPMTRCRAIGGVPNALMAEYYAQRATAALMITEGTATSPNALGYARMPGIFSAEQVRGWRGVTDRVHESGGRIFVQLMHVGRIAQTENLPPNTRVVAPSAVPAAGTMWTDTKGLLPISAPEAMSATDLAEALAEFVQSAKNAREAGFDGVELHAANGYLLEQFLHPHTNRRDDAYGGSVAKRQRFVFEVAQAVADAISGERVGMRLSPYGTFNDMPAYDAVEETYVGLANQLRGRIAYLHVIGHTSPSFPATAQGIRREFGSTIIINGNFDRASAEAALAEGKGDLVAFGRPFVSNPDFVERSRRGATLAAPDPSTFYTAGPEGYVDYAPLAS